MDPRNRSTYTRYIKLPRKFVVSPVGIEINTIFQISLPVFKLQPAHRYFQLTLAGFGIARCTVHPLVPHELLDGGQVYPLSIRSRPFRVPQHVQANLFKFGRVLITSSFAHEKEFAIDGYLPKYLLPSEGQQCGWSCLVPARSRC